MGAVKTDVNANAVSYDTIAVALECRLLRFPQDKRQPCVWLFMSLKKSSVYPRVTQNLNTLDTERASFSDG